MKHSLTLALCFLIVVNPIIASAQSQSTSAQPTASQPTVARAALTGFGLEDGTPIRLRLSRNVSSADAKTGETVDFEVLEEVKVGNVIVVPRGGVAWATVTDAEPKKRMGRGGKLNVNIDSVRLVDGEKIPLRAIKETKGGGHVGAMTGAMVATGIVFFPAAPLFLFMHGKDISIPKGTEITAYVNGNVPLELAKFQVGGAAGAKTTTEVATGKLQITSQPQGADVEVDGSFVGNTPATLTLPIGEHIIAVKKAGHKTWQRTIKVAVGEVNLTSELEKELVGPPPGQ
jgi:PEGA domain